MCPDVPADGVCGSASLVYVDSHPNGRRDPGERFARLEPDGSYTLGDLPAGEYPVRIEIAAGWSLSSPLEDGQRISLAAGQVRTGIDFHLQPSSGLWNADPHWLSEPGRTAIADDLYRYDAVAVDPENHPLQFDLPLAPAGMTVHTERGTVVWVPTRDQVGSHQVVLRARDDRGGHVLQSFEILVTTDGLPEPVPSGPPRIISVPPIQAAVDHLYRYPVQVQVAESAKDLGGDDPGGGDPGGGDSGGGDPSANLQFRLLAAPSGMHWDDVAGELRWTPALDQLGSHSVRVAVEDPQGGTDLQSYIVTVCGRATQSAAADRLGARRGRRHRASLPGDGGRRRSRRRFGPLSAGTWSGRDDHRPADRAAPLARPARGEARITVVASDPQGARGSQSWTLLAAENRPPEIRSLPPTAVFSGKPYRYDVHAVDPDGDRLVYALDDAPVGMRIDDRGRIRWTPAASLGDAAIPVTVRVSDPAGQRDTQAFVLQVAADAEPPQVQLAVSASVVDRGGSVRVEVQVSDNVAVDSVAIRLNGTTLPDGITFPDGQPVPVQVQDGYGVSFLSMDQVGLFEITATARDTAGNQAASEPWPIRVVDPADSQGPLVQILSPAGGEHVAYRTDVVGTVQSPELEWWRVDLAASDTVDLSARGR